MEEDDVAELFRDEPEDEQRMHDDAGSAGGSAPRTDETAGGTCGTTQDASMGGTTSRNPSVGEPMRRGSKRESEGVEDPDGVEARLDDGRDINAVSRRAHYKMSQGRRKDFLHEDVNEVNKKFERNDRLSNMDMVRETLR